MSDINSISDACIGLGYATGTLWCDKRVIPQRGYYKEIAYVWESGFIDWRADERELEDEFIKAVINDSENKKSKFISKREAYAQKLAEYEKLKEEGSADKTYQGLNLRRWLLITKQEIEDLEEHHTTQVIHY